MGDDGDTLMKALLIGSGGQVGRALVGALGSIGDVVPLDHAALDVGDLAAVRAAVRAHRPDVVINASAYTLVDKAEGDETTATRINGDAVAALGEECKSLRIGLVHYSTDFVFDGKATRPYREDDPTAPLGAYGRSKLAGEKALVEMEAPAVILRTAWVYSVGRPSFVSAILRAAREREALRVVSDQVGNPTFAADLAVATALMLFGVRADAYEGIASLRSIYHLAGRGFTSRYELAKAIVELDPKKAEHRVKTIEPIASSEYPLPAQRPAYAPLDCSKAKQRLGVELPDWRQALARALAQ
jgi:dTDP-4-dehydrorhamnose reductase